MVRQQQRPVMWCSNPDGRRGKDGYAGPSVGGPIGYVGLGAVLLLMVGFKEAEMMIKKNGLPLRMSYGVG